MRVLVVTEKASSNSTVLDGGASLLSTLRKNFADALAIMQFGPASDTYATWSYAYPKVAGDRFSMRIAHADFIAQRVYQVAEAFDHIIFIHVSMHFGIKSTALPTHVTTWSMPMFLTPSYVLSNEEVPPAYTRLETIALQGIQRIITPSHFEKQQLTNFYKLDPSKIKVIPRGIARSFTPSKRTLTQQLGFCSIGSIKAQKDTISLVRVFKDIQDTWPNSYLKIIGAVQDQQFYEQVLAEIQKLGLKDVVRICGYCTTERLVELIQDCHIHLSLSRCETFGRSIFETLACGIPNVVLKQANAAYDYLNRKPYIKFVDGPEQYTAAIQEVLAHYKLLSEWASEVHTLYADSILGKILKGAMTSAERMVISDFDGTLYHKDSSTHTAYMMNHFRNYDKRILCSARGLADLLVQNAQYNLKADWLISYSGGVVADGTGKVLWTVPLTDTVVNQITSQYPSCTKITFAGKVLQLVLPQTSAVSIIDVTREIYEKQQYLLNVQASKLGAIVWLLQTIDWEGAIDAWGDGPNDAAWLAYFDGLYVTTNMITNQLTKEHHAKATKIL